MNDRDCFISVCAPPRNNRFHATFNIGGGVVADSEPESKLEEINLKVKGIMSALGLEI